MKKGWLALLCCAVLAFFQGNAQAEEGDRVDSSARAAVLIERHTGRVLLSHNAHEALPMASTTKVMTALIAIEKGDLNDVVTVGRNAYGVPGTSIYLGLGEKITLRDLLYGLMLASGNDAAVAIAEHIAGDVPSFCAMMTQRAQELGCENTQFATPHGLPSKDHFTTAADLARIAQEAMKHDVFRQIVSTRRASIPWEGRSYHRILNNKNKLLSDYEGATGIKTGYTKAAGRCLVFGAKRNGLEVIGVVLGCSDWFSEAARLMDMGFERYEISNYARAGFESHHNCTYWLGGEYLGLGCAAHSLMNETRFGNPPELEKYLAGERMLDKTRRSIDDRKEETIMLATRMVRGLDLTAWKMEFGEDFLVGHAKAIHKLQNYGLIEIEENHLRLTIMGLELQDSVVLELMD